MNALQLAERLAEDREKIDRAVVSYCPIPVFNAGRDGKWLAVNEPFARLIAVDSDDLLGYRWQKMLASDASLRIRKEWEALLDSKMDTTKINFTFKAGDGRIVKAWCSLIRVDNDRWLGFMIPICETPVNCPVHCFLLHNLENEVAKT